MPSYQDWLSKRKERISKPLLGVSSTASTLKGEDVEDNISVISGSVYSAGGTRLGELVTRVSKLEDTVISLAEQVQRLASTLEMVLAVIDNNKEGPSRATGQPEELDSSPILEK